MAAAAVILLGTPFIVIKSNQEDKRFCHIFNTEPIKTAFNSSNLIISVFIAGASYLKAGGVLGNLNLPNALLPGILSIILYFILNCGILIILFAIDQKVSFFPMFIKNIVEFFPNIIASV
ncbi:MAG TPA: hypothetical protein DDW53_13935, partial [Lachnoclostridium sp.]|nr:hypothetical protein [Lachnoclostridium sp.]